MKGHSGNVKMWSLHMKFTEQSYLTDLVKTISSLVKLWAMYLHEFLVSKETMVLRRWERSKQKFGFIKRVDKGWITSFALTKG